MPTWIFVAQFHFLVGFQVRPEMMKLVDDVASNIWLASVLPLSEIPRWQSGDVRNNPHSSSVSL